MKRSTPVLILLALLALVPCTSMAQTPPAAMPPASSVTVPTVPANVADFLATLSDAPGARVLPPAPRFLSTPCTSDLECPPGYKCCYPCGIDGCDFVCMEVERNRCPFIP
ncbi:MAG TPA: hypothetical protein VGB06_05875 [Solirubrobacterales bacterium]|jgi:hypothetical protein